MVRLSRPLCPIRPTSLTPGADRAYSLAINLENMRSWIALSGSLVICYYNLMNNNYIDKLAFIYLKDRKILTTLSAGKDTWYIPGGKREEGESDIEALVREVKEELSVDIRPNTAKLYGVFEAQAHGKAEGMVVRMTCYEANFDGELHPSAEVEKMAFVNYGWKDKSSDVDKLIFDDLRSKNLID